MTIFEDATTIESQINEMARWSTREQRQILALIRKQQSMILDLAARMIPGENEIEAKNVERAEF